MNKGTLSQEEMRPAEKAGSSSALSHVSHFKPDVAVLVAAACLLTLFYWWVYGLLWLHGAYQLLDYNLLLQDAMRSIWYCHSQPPLYNMLTAIALKVACASGFNPSLGIGLMLLAMTAVTVLCVYYCARTYLPNERCMLVFALLYAMNTSLHSYAYWFYDFMCHAFTMIFICGFAAWVRHGSVRGLWLCMAAVSALGLTRSHFSFWFCVSLVGLCVISGVFVRKSGAKLWGAPAAAAMVLLALWPIKNAIVFGRFTSSSWGSYTMARATPFAGSWYGDFLRNGQLHEVANQQCPYRHPALLAAEKTLFMGGGGGANWNHYKLLLMLDHYVRAGIKWRLDHPKEWFGHAVFFYTKATMHDCKHFLDQTPRRSGSVVWKILDMPNRYLIYLDFTSLIPGTAREYLERQKKELVQWLSADEWVPVQVTLFGLIIQPSLFILAVYLFVRGGRDEKAVALMYLWVMAYMYGTTMLTDGNEGYRMLFPVKGMHLLLMLCFMARLFPKGEGSVHRKKDVAA